MIRYSVKVNDQIYQVDLEKDTTIHDAESTESSADICFEAIKADALERLEKLGENADNDKKEFLQAAVEIRPHPQSGMMLHLSTMMGLSCTLTVWKKHRR